MTGAAITKGRVARAILLSWHRAGSPAIAPAPEVVATVEYRAIDKLGRVNGKTRHKDVYRHQLAGGKGRPATIEYLNGSGLTRDNSIVSRIVTANGAIHSVFWDHENDEYVIKWESKADQRAVIVSLLETIAQYRALAESHGLAIADAPVSDDPTLF